jgi:hypothetical protein
MSQDKFASANSCWDTKKRISVTIGGNLAAFSESSNWLATAATRGKQIHLRARDGRENATEPAQPPYHYERLIDVNSTAALGFRAEQNIATDNGETFKLQRQELLVADCRASLIRRYLPGIGHLKPIEVAQPTALANDASGRWLACGGSDGRVTLFDLNSINGPLAVARSAAGKAAITKLVFTSCNRQICGLYGDGTALIIELGWGIASGNLSTVNNLRVKNGQLFALAAHRSCRQIVLAGEGPTWLCNLENNETSTLETQLGNYVYFAQFLSGNELLLAGEKGLELHKIAAAAQPGESEKQSLIWHLSLVPATKLVALHESEQELIMAVH